MATRGAARRRMQSLAATGGFGLISPNAGLFTLHYAMQESSPPILGMVPADWKCVCRDELPTQLFLSGLHFQPAASAGVRTASAGREAATAASSLTLVLQAAQQ
eukprot:4672721-Pleurochrysis_carterae.AAC.1